MKNLNVNTAVELKAGEEVITSLNPSKWVYFGSAIACIIFIPFALLMAIADLSFSHTIDGAHPMLWFALVIMLLCGVMFLKDFIYQKTTILTITDKRIIRKSGWLSVDIQEIQREKIEAVHVQQGIINRILKIGTIVATGSGGYRVGMRAVPAPRAVRQLIGA